jgi:hypothetical protein
MVAKLERERERERGGREKGLGSGGVCFATQDAVPDSNRGGSY